MMQALQQLVVRLSEKTLERMRFRLSYNPIALLNRVNETKRKFSRQDISMKYTTNVDFINAIMSSEIEYE